MMTMMVIIICRQMPTLVRYNFFEGLKNGQVVEMGAGMKTAKTYTVGARRETHFTVKF
jgi:hypothetical protein